MEWCRGRGGIEGLCAVVINSLPTSALAVPGVPIKVAPLKNFANILRTIERLQKFSHYRSTIVYPPQFVFGKFGGLTNWQINKNGSSTGV